MQQALLESRAADKADIGRLLMVTSQIRISWNLLYSSNIRWNYPFFKEIRKFSVMEQIGQQNLAAVPLVHAPTISCDILTAIYFLQLVHTNQFT